MIRGDNRPQFVIEKNDMLIEHQSFQVGIHKQTGQITMFSAPDISVEQIEKFHPTKIKPIVDILPLQDIKLQLEWNLVYGEKEEESSHNRVIYRIVSTTDAFVKGINAQTGEVIYSLI